MTKKLKTVSTAARSKSPHQRRVEEFMLRAGHAAPDVPALPDFHVLRLRLRLVIEEALELAEAFGIGVRPLGTSSDYDSWPLCMDNLSFNKSHEPDLVKAVDALADLSVVITGAMSALGVADVTLLKEVDANNLAKFKDGCRIDQHGKFCKPPGHRPPDFKRVLSRQGYENE